jgi:HPt (histidine-containing phosphotransfer) domain-containing protein
MSTVSNVPLPPAGGPAVLDPQALEQLRQLDPQGTSGIVLRVLQTYQRSLDRFVTDVQSATASGDHAALGRLTHTLRSSSASVGALRLSGLCKAIESDIREGRTAELPVLLDALQAECASVQLALAAMLTGQAAVQPSPS